MNNKFNWATFESHWDRLLSDCAKGKENEKNTPLTKLHKKAYCPTNKNQVTS